MITAWSSAIVGGSGVGAGLGGGPVPAGWVAAGGLASAGPVAAAGMVAGAGVDRAGMVAATGLCGGAALPPEQAASSASPRPRITKVLRRARGERAARRRLRAGAR